MTNPITNTQPTAAVCDAIALAPLEIRPARHHVIAKFAGTTIYLKPLDALLAARALLDAADAVEAGTTNQDDAQ